MAGKVAVLNDLAGFGRCSLTAAISVLSAMGVQPCPLPTAVLSAQTGFESYFFQDLTEQMGMITEEWKKSGAQFDGIVTGFMSDHRQIGEVNHFLDLFHKEGTFLLVDPVLGDNGKRFSVFDGLFQKEMKQLVKRADIVTPNVTELCLLTDYDYDKIQNISETGDREALFLEVSKAAGRLLDSGVSEVIVTGVLFEEQDAAKECTVGKETGTGGRKVANLTVTREKTTAGISSFIGASYSGTGDLFASVIAGGKARGDRTEDSVRLAGSRRLLGSRQRLEFRGKKEQNTKNIFGCCAKRRKKAAKKRENKERMWKNIEKYHKNEENLNRSGGRVVIPICE